MYKIALIELETHPEILNLWFKILETSMIFNTDFYISIKLKSFINFESKANIYWFDVEKETEKKFLDTNFNNKVYDLVIINTLHKRCVSYQKIINNYKTLCLIHNLNFVFQGLKKINFISFFNKKISDFIFFNKLFFKEKIWSFFKKNQSKIIFGSLLKNPILNFQQKIHLIPLFFIENKNQNKNIQDKINIVIAGEISDSRKNITKLIEILKNIKPKNNLEFTFLGKTTNYRIISDFEQINLNNKAIKIIFFTQRIPEYIFNEYIQKADLLLCPIKQKTTFNFIKETYSETKISGNEFDCIKNHKIGIFPLEYNFSHWENFYYKDFEDLKEILINISLEKIQKKQNELNLITNKYEFSVVQKKIENILLEFIQ